MAFTQSDIDAIRQAIATGQLIVRSGDRMINYRSLDEMRGILRMMEAEVNPPTGASSGSIGRRVYTQFQRPS